MKYHKVCECCGSKVSAYTHNLNKPLVGALRQLVNWYEQKRIPANLQKNLNLTHNQIANFQKLKHFKLVVNAGSGGWVPTSEGLDFIYGRMRVLNPVATMSNEVLSYSHEAWATHSKKPEMVSVFDIDEECYKQRPEYQAEKSSQFNLNF